MTTSILYNESPILGLVFTAAPIAAAYYGSTWLTAVLVLLLLFLLYFYRYSAFNQRFTDDVIVSPACGVVTKMMRLSNGNTLVSVFLSPLDRHTQIYPVNGVVVKRIYDETGKFNIVTDYYKSRENEKKIHFILTRFGLVKVTQIAGFLPRRIASSDSVGVSVKAGEYLGMIKFGSRVDVEFPAAFGVAVSEGQRVEIGSLLARLSLVNRSEK